MILSPEQLRQLSVVDLRRLAEDLRQEILSACLKNGGHLGASLGAVELAIALHRTFESPREPIIWDVGHQAYAHKLITGRWNEFGTLRQTGGLSGFLSRAESEHDVFGAGHSSTALSAALAMAWSRGREPGAKPAWTVAVVGDGGMTAGLALEALNNARAIPTAPLLIVLNDNQMSISPNVGAVPAILAGGQARQFFECFGLDYAGPIDGHDLPLLLGTLDGIRRAYAGRPVVLHVLTQKGKGYIPAEESPAAYHGVSPVQQAKVNPAQSTVLRQKSYSETFGEAICALAERDPRIVAITAAMPEGTGLVEFARRFPERFFDVGIAEAHAVTFAAGLATQGLRPVVAIYSTFLQRALDGIIHDVALQELPVIFAIDRAGIVGADGPTHHGAFDLAYLGMIPGMQLTCPSCLDDVRVALARGLLSDRPFALRYPRGSGPQSFEVAAEDDVRWHHRLDSPELIAVALGAAASRVIEAARQADPEGSRIAVVSTTLAKPLAPALVAYLERYRDARLVTVEDGVLRGGFGQGLTAALRGRKGIVTRLGYGDRFIPHGSVPDLEEAEGTSARALTERFRELIS